MKVVLFPRYISLYILRAHIGPFVFSLSTLPFLFVLQFIMKFIDQLVGKGLSAWTILELISLNLAWMVVLAVPMSVLVAVLMAFGDLSAKNEITAMKASGVSIYRMMAPVFIAAGALAVLLVMFNNDVLPEANHKAKTLAMDIRRKRPTFSIVAGLFSQEIQGYSILVHKTFEKSNDLEGITLYDYTNPNYDIVITAQRGTISLSPDARKLIMDLQDGEIHELNLVNMTEYKRIRFSKHRIVTEVEGFGFERTQEGVVIRGDRELSAATMRAIVDSLQRARNSLDSNLQALLNREFDRLLTGKTASPTTQERSPYSPFTGGVQIFSSPSYSIPANEPPDTRVRIISSTIQSELMRIDFVEKQIDQYEVEIYKKYAIPVACLVFVLVGVPLGIMARRGGFGMAATLSLGFFLLYWACLIGGEKLADRGIFSPFWGMWAANIIIGVMGIILTIRIGRESVVLTFDVFKCLLPRRWQEQLAERERERAALEQP
ncbi:MAG: YjgP/YjgQ family permease [Ignavibacteria bacterium]